MILFLQAAEFFEEYLDIFQFFSIE